jgi:hypothetical protein
MVVGASVADQGLDAKLKGLRVYTRQTLQQYANGATLGKVRAQQQSVSAASEQGPNGSSPNMQFMQNATRIVLLTVESLQQSGLVLPRAALIRQLRMKLGMAEAPLPPPAALTARRTPVCFATHLDSTKRSLFSARKMLTAKGALTKLQARA